MFSSTAKSSRVEQLRTELAQKQAEARQLDNRYRQLALCAEPVAAVRPTVELVEQAAEPDRRARFFGEFLRSLILRDHVDDVRSLVRSRPYLLHFEDVHRGMTGKAYATSLGDRAQILAVLDEVKCVVEKGASETLS